MSLAEPSALPVDVIETHHRHEMLREGAVMVLYVSIVVLAALAVVPDDSTPDTAGLDHGSHLLGLIWGTSVGLALAHWFAFELAAVGFRGGRFFRKDLEIALAQVVGAIVVAAAATVAVVIAEPENELEAAAFVPAVTIGIAGYLVVRAAGRERHVAIAGGLAALVVGLAIAATKAWLTAH